MLMYPVCFQSTFHRVRSANRGGCSAWDIVRCISFIRDVFKDAACLTRWQRNTVVKVSIAVHLVVDRLFSVLYVYFWSVSQFLSGSMHDDVRLEGWNRCSCPLFGNCFFVRSSETCCITSCIDARFLWNSVMAQSLLAALHSESSSRPQPVEILWSTARTHTVIQKLRHIYYRVYLINDVERFVFRQRNWNCALERWPYDSRHVWHRKQLRHYFNPLCLDCRSSEYSTTRWIMETNVKKDWMALVGASRSRDGGLHRVVGRSVDH